jgi:diphthamide biosynthesis protein 2
MHILADTTYGSCCVDEKTAKHVDGDAIIHFGPSCLSATSRTPVLYIFTRPRVQVKDIVEVYRTNFSADEKVVVVYDVIYEEVAQEFFRELELGGAGAAGVILSQLVIPGTETNSSKAPAEPDHENWVVKYGRRLPSDLVNIFYIGSANGRALLNLMLSLPSVKFSIYDPLVRILEEKTVQLPKLLMKRNYYIEKVKDSGTVGILIGTLAVEKYLEIIQQIKETLRRAGKNYYTVSIGDITPPKLANFPDIEVFVLVACPECSVVDSKEFFQPIITPFELELAFNKGREWTGEYIIDYRVLLPGKSKPKMDSDQGWHVLNQNVLKQCFESCVRSMFCIE